jgi:uncharacterized protein (TIGR02186 family)
MAVQFRHFALLGAMVVAIQMPPSARAAEELVADISSHQIAITSRFAGTSLLLFGAVDWFEARVDHKNPADARDYDIVVVAQGPDLPQMVRKKAEVAGIWVNAESAELDPIPGYYALSATRRLDDMFLPGEAEKYGLGLDQIPFAWTGAPPSDPKAYKAAVLRTMRSSGLYLEKFGSLEILGETLFRTEIYFPANVPVGRYRADVYLVRDGVVVTHYSAPLSVDKIGIERAVYDFAKTSPATYGLMAVMVAVAAGLLAGAVSRRFSH